MIKCTKEHIEVEGNNAELLTDVMTIVRTVRDALGMTKEEAEKAIKVYVGLGFKTKEELEDIAIELFKTRKEAEADE